LKNVQIWLFGIIWKRDFKKKWGLWFCGFVVFSFLFLEKMVVTRSRAKSIKKKLRQERKKTFLKHLESQILPLTL